MDISTFVKLGFKHTKNATAETVYLKTGYDMTKPVTFYGLINERCNVKCRHCEYWRLKHYEEELTILPIKPLHALSIYKIPQLHKDPFDRVLIIQSIIEQIPLITVDNLINKYKQYGLTTLW